jgi:hypothetical protein
VKRFGATALASALFCASAFAQTERIEPPPDDRRYVGVVIGLSTYANLPDEIELDFARSDAAMVAGALREDAKFDDVFLLTDTEATKAAIQETLRTKVSQLVGASDVLVVYIVGHGIGADLDLPTILSYDSTLENGQEDGFALDMLVRDMKTWLRAGTMLIATDIIHDNQLDGIYFYGPAANQWPLMADGTMVLSSSGPKQPAEDGAFGKVFAKAIGGAADRNDDGWVTGSELFTYIDAALSTSPQTPMAAGNYNGYMILAEGVERDSDGLTVGAPSEVYPDVTIDKAKFVFREGAGQTVQCPNQPVVTCDPSCYVWQFPAGPCAITAVIDGFPMKGKTVILSRGKYECRRQGPDLSCLGPG